MGSIVATLIPHPQSNPKAVQAIKVEIGRERPGELTIIFKLEGDMSRIRIEPKRPNERADNLWQSTCFECFVGDQGQDAYREFNLSPRGGWAAYDFETYRAGMTKLTEMPLAMVQEEGEGLLTLRSHLPQHIVAEPRQMPDWRVGLSAVVEETDGTKSYWALAHPPGKPDFHHPDCFTLELPPPEYSYEIRN